MTKGRVFDKDRRDTLTGTEVLVKGTSTGASADFNEDYLIHNAPYGEQKVVVSYIGYQSANSRAECISTGCSLTTLALQEN